MPRPLRQRHARAQRRRVSDNFTIIITYALAFGSVNFSSRMSRRPCRATPLFAAFAIEAIQRIATPDSAQRTNESAGIGVAGGSQRCPRTENRR